MNADILIDVLRSQYQNILQHEVYQCFISFLIACAISVTSIPVIINISRLLGLQNKPNSRSSHKHDTPLFGGVAIYASLLVAHFIWPHTAEQPDAYLTSLSVVGLTSLFFLGLKDDILILDPNKKLLIQVLAVSTLVLLGGLKVDNLFGIFGWFEIPDLVSIPFTIFIFIALINAINLIDGVDGLAGGIAFIAGLSFGTWFLLNHHFSMACMAFSLSGALLGFLRFNFSKTSKIFMGDTGSLILGFMLAFFAVKFIRLNVTYRHDADAFFNAPVLAVMLLIVPIFDTLRVFLVRILNRKSPFKADRNHFHHILLDNGLTHFQTSFSLWSVTIFNVIGYFFTFKYVTNTEAFFVLVGLFIVYLMVGYLLKLRATSIKEKKSLRVAFKTSHTMTADEPYSWAKRVIRGL
ncbi:MAG: undecaprenyl/decaprenyl-phosphate alpha-N-acetylglucosaminyl 1-phosphate transferase [Spirosomaceae bacterium]|nr:undecaprenyl/decaprenyl-phosphate alpha-N-acetylglucosaminyl 1-phosphate transferase [Spirosomataceae bacterium]